MNMSSQFSALLPVRIDLRKKNVMLVGNDRRAPRLAEMLAPYAGRLYILSEAALKRETLYGMDAVISASSDSRLNDELFAVCRTLGILICILDQPQRSDFILQLPDT